MAYNLSNKEYTECLTVGADHIIPARSSDHIFLAGGRPVADSPQYFHTSRCRRARRSHLPPGVRQEQSIVAHVVLTCAAVPELGFSPHTGLVSCWSPPCRCPGSSRRTRCFRSTRPLPHRRHTRPFLGEGSARTILKPCRPTPRATWRLNSALYRTQCWQQSHLNFQALSL